MPMWPSLGLIIYAALASVSVGALFVGTIVPGLLVAGALMLTVYVMSRKRGYGGDIPKATLRQRMTSLGLAIPALILQVTSDALAPVEVGRYMHDKMPQSQLTLVDTVGHCPHLSAPEQTVEAMRSFLAS